MTTNTCRAFARAMMTALSLGAANAYAGAEHECLMTPSMTLRLSTAIEGTLAAVAVDKGDRVAAGAVVATLDAEVEAARVAEAQARVEMRAAVQARDIRRALSRRKLERAESLSQKKFISADELDELRTTLKHSEQEYREALEQQALAKLQLARAEAEARRRVIRSPIEGVVVERLLGPGEFARGQAIVEIAALDPLHVEVVLPVAMFGSVRPGTVAHVRPAAPVGGDYEARVAVVDDIIDAASGTFGVRLVLDNPGQRLPGGLECMARFDARGAT